MFIQGYFHEANSVAAGNPLSEAGHGVDGGRLHKKNGERAYQNELVAFSAEESAVPDFSIDFEVLAGVEQDFHNERRQDTLGFRGKPGLIEAFEGERSLCTKEVRREIRVPHLKLQVGENFHRKRRKKERKNQGKIFLIDISIKLICVCAFSLP